MTGVFIIGLLLFLGLAVGLFLILGGNNGNGQSIFFMGNQPWTQYRRQNQLTQTLQAGNLPLTEENQEEATEVYKHQLYAEEERRYFLNNMGIGLVVVLAFSLFFLLVGSLVYYHFAGFRSEQVNSRFLLYIVLVFLPFVLYFIGLLLAIKGFKLNIPFYQVPGYDRVYSQLGVENTILNLLKEETSRGKLALAKLVEQFNLMLELNNRKQTLISYAKYTFLFGVIATLPLVILIVADYFNMHY